eukprot:7943-Eustigmatos_ZCMA.PRE.1
MHATFALSGRAVSSCQREGLGAMRGLKSAAVLFVLVLSRYGSRRHARAKLSDRADFFLSCQRK